MNRPIQLTPTDVERLLAYKRRKANGWTFMETLKRVPFRVGVCTSLLSAEFTVAPKTKDP